MRGMFAGMGTWEMNGSKAKEVRFRELLFVDDTTIVGMKEELVVGVITMKEVMNKFKERGNDQKEESLDVYMKSVWFMGRYKRGCQYEDEKSGWLWAKMKEELKNTRLSKRWQARIVQAGMKSALLF